MSDNTITTAQPAQGMIPEGLCELGQRAAEGIVRFLSEHDATEDLHGCLYSPQEWTERGERFGRNSLLIITHDGGEHAGAFDPEQDWETGLNDDIYKHLRQLGFMTELCDSWYSAVYERHDG